jgi:hypothetical protein
MINWLPITKSSLGDLILRGESRLNEPHLRLWNLVKIHPVKWSACACGEMGGGFWVVGIVGNLILWYNDIENGFNVSRYIIHGEIAEYYCNQDELDIAVMRLYGMIENGIGLIE